MFKGNNTRSLTLRILEPRTTTPRIAELKTLPSKSLPQIAPQQSEFEIPKMVEPGESGIHFAVTVNLYPITIPQKIVIHYDFKCEPEPQKLLYRSVFGLFAKKHFPTRNVAFDGRNNVYAYPALDFQEKQDTMFIPISDTGIKKRYKIRITEVARIDLDEIRRYMSAGSSLQVPQAAIQTLNVVLGQTPMDLIDANRSFFKKPEMRDLINLGGGFETYRGLFQSVVIGSKNLYLNADVAHKGFPIEQSVLKFLSEENCDFQSGLLNDRDFFKLNKYIKGLKVNYQIPHVAGSKRVYRVNGVSLDNAEKTKFKTDKGVEYTVQEYYASEKRTLIKYPKLNLLHVGSSSRSIYVPIEFCQIVGGQVTNKNMTEKQTANMIRAAAKAPADRKNDIFKLMRTTEHNSNPTVQEFEITVHDHFEEVNARILNSPVLEYHEGKTKIKPKNGVWKVDCNFRKPANLREWMVLNMDDRVRPDEIERMINMLCQAGRNGGMEIDPRPFIRNVETRNLTLQSVQRCLYKQKDDYPNLQLAIVIMPNQPSIYSRIKCAAELDCGLLTQCVKSFTVQKLMNLSVAANLMLKINTKMNGVNHALTDRTLIFTVPVMIVGADVTHPSPGQKQIPSIAGVAASFDWFGFRYIMDFKLQPPRVEIIQDLEKIMINMLSNFKWKNNGQLPHRIIFYRDGVSEGQFSQVLNFELTAIRKALEKKYHKDEIPPVTFLVVQKRHHIRFFPPLDSKFAEGRYRNIPPGTVVDTKITHPTEIGFYLSSHAAVQGTSRPCKYHLLWDDANLSTDEIEKMTYHLCYLFARCNRSVSYPAPTYYAHLIASRARVYMEERQLGSNDMKKLSTERHCGLVKRVICDGNPMFFI